MEKEKKNNKDLKWKIFLGVFQKNQILIGALALMIAAAGYMNFAARNTADKEKEVTDLDICMEDGEDSLALQSSDLLITDPEYVDTEMAYYNNTEEIIDVSLMDDLIALEDDEKMTESDNSAQTDDEIDELPGEAVFTSGEAVATLLDARLLKEQTRAKNKEILLEIVNNKSIDDKQKQDAIDSIVAMTERSEKEMSAEILLETKGFEHAVVSISGETADVCVAVEYLDEIKSAQIVDIVTRKTGIKSDKIVISTVTNFEDKE